MFLTGINNHNLFLDINIENGSDNLWYTLTQPFSGNSLFYDSFKPNIYNILTGYDLGIQDNNVKDIQDIYQFTGGYHSVNINQNNPAAGSYSHNLLFSDSTNFNNINKDLYLVIGLKN